MQAPDSPGPLPIQPRPPMILCGPSQRCSTVRERSVVDQLDASTVHGHLIRRRICDSTDRLLHVESLSSKNLNLLVTLSRSIDQASPMTTRYLVKQSPFREASASGDGFRQEWNLYQWIRTQLELSALWTCLPDPVDHDPQSGILAFRFLECYQDLSKTYAISHVFPTRLAAALGASVAAVHRATFKLGKPFTCIDRAGADHGSEPDQPPDLCGELEDLTPEIFRKVPRDALKFYVLYQRAPEISDAVLALENDYQACCLTHHDLKFANVLVHKQWAEWALPSWPAQPADLALAGGEGVMRLIDWEHWRWGDPAFDLGTLVAEYLRTWLKSVPISRDLDPETALHLAAVPLETLQPSMRSLIETYLSQFPAILEHFSDFPARVLRFAGLGLLKAIQDRLHYKETFGNLEICMMQVGRSLLCHPEVAMSTLFGGKELKAARAEDQQDPRWVDPVSLLPLQAAIPIPPEPSRTLPSEAIPLSLWPPYGTWHNLLEELCANVFLEHQEIRHPAYPSLQLNHLAQSTGDQEATYRLRQIRNYLHAIYFSGELNQPDDLPLPGDPFTCRLEAANSGVGYADSGWIVIREGKDDVLVAKQGLHLWVNPTLDLVMQPHGSGTGQPASGFHPSAGASVTLRLPNATWIGEHYVAIGDAGEPLSGAPALDLFFHITAEGAIVLMKCCIPMLNRKACPFTLKVLADPHRYGRLDGAILRIPTAEYGPIQSLLSAHHPELGPHLSSPIPLFTYPLAEGIGLAEVPDNGAEFGVDRCELLAEGLVAAQAHGQARIRAIQDLFGQRGLDWHQPHLNPGSTGSYPSLGLPMSLSMAAERCGS